MATSFFYIYVMAISFFYIYVMATSFFYIYIDIYIDITLTLHWHYIDIYFDIYIYIDSNMISRWHMGPIKIVKFYLVTVTV